MNKLRTLSMAAAAGLLAAVSAQAPAAQEPVVAQAPPTQGTLPPMTNPEPEAASSEHQRDVTGRTEEADESAVQTNPSNPSQSSTPNQREVIGSNAGANERAAGTEKQMAGDTKPKDKLVGLPVQSSKSDSTGNTQQLGSVVDIVRDKGGKPAYAIVAIDNDTTAIPYDVATSSLHAGKLLVLSPDRLASAPRVTQSEWLDQKSSKWRTESDRYWGNTRTAQPADAPMPKER
jgi:hypothetical protein